MESYVDGINNIVEAQQRVALQYLEDGSIEDACPPLQALLIIMATGKYLGMTVHHADFRALFTRDNLLASDWYKERLEIKQQRDIAMWNRHVDTLNQFLDDADYADEARRLDIPARLNVAIQKLEMVSNPDYLNELVGTLGADPLRPVRSGAGDNVITWNKAKLATMDKAGNLMEEASIRAYKTQSFIQRVKSRFKRVRLS